jgi:hypothetical protein
LGEPTLQRRRQEALLDYLREEIRLEEEGIGQDVLEARYLANPEYQLTVRHLVLLVEEGDSEEDRASDRARAQEALERIQAGEPFDEVAGEVSEEPGAADRGGLLRPGRRGSWVDAFWDAASVLEVGEVSPVVESPYGFHVIKLEDRSPVPFPEARRRVVREVANLLPPREERIQTWSDSVRQLGTVDTTALRRAWQGASESLFVMANEWLGSREAETAFGSWPGGTVTGRELRTFFLAHDRATWEQVSQDGWEGVLQVTREATFRGCLATIAGTMDLRIPPEAEGQIEGEWMELVNAWEGAFGFREGMTPEEIRLQAMEGAASTAQSTRIAREQVRSWGPLLLAAYPLGP